jgi:hypothetical protein
MVNMLVLMLLFGGASALVHWIFKIDEASGKKLQKDGTMRHEVSIWAKIGLTVVCGGALLILIGLIISDPTTHGSANDDVCYGSMRC